MSKVTKNSIGVVKIICLNCKKEFLLHKSRATYIVNGKEYKAKYCSKECRKEYLLNNRIKDKTYTYPNNAKCKVCGISFYTAPANIKYGNGIYCSKKCFGIDKSKNITTICEVCGNEIKTYQCRIGIRKYCSRKCKAIAATKEKSEITTIERKRGESKEWTKAIYLRDNWTCQKCGKRGGELNAHHVIPYSIDETLRYEFSNGITLCKKCHKKEHDRLRKISIEQTDIFSVKKRNYSKKE